MSGFVIGLCLKTSHTLRLSQISQTITGPGMESGMTTNGPEDLYIIVQRRNHIELPSSIIANLFQFDKYEVHVCLVLIFCQHPQSSFEILFDLAYD